MPPMTLMELAEAVGLTRPSIVRRLQREGIRTMLVTRVDRAGRMLEMVCVAGDDAKFIIEKYSLARQEGRNAGS